MIPLTLDAAFAGGGMGMVSGLLNKYLENKRQIHLDGQKAVQQARLIKSESFRYTGAAIALILVLYICIGPFIASLLDIPVATSYAESNGPITWFFTGTYNIKWVAFNGFVITPIHAYAMSAALFFYMGSRR